MKGLMYMRLKSVFIALVVTFIPSISYAENCGEVSANDQLIECLGNEFSKTDKTLNKVYKDLRARVSQDGKEFLRKGQIAWLIYRDKDCEFQAEAVSGGQVFEPTYISCQIKKTEYRIVELKKSGW